MTGRMEHIFIHICIHKYVLEKPKKKLLGTDQAKEDI